MYKGFAILAACLALTACSTTQDGVKIGFGHSPSTSDIGKIRDQVEQNAQSATAKEVVAGALAGKTKAGITMVGSVGPLRKVDGDARHRFYASYTADAMKWHPGGKPDLSEQSFVSTVAGWTSVETFGIPGVMNIRQTTLVKDADVGNIGFPSTLGSALGGMTGDLVVAKSNSDGVFIIEGVLCKDSAADYRDCAHKYEKGRFDMVTGRELDRDMKPKAGGVRIDPVTYKVIK